MVQPLVLVLEDLHWSDASTVEVLALLARRREAARLLVLGTYRPVEVMVHDHPLKVVKQELRAARAVYGSAAGLSASRRRWRLCGPARVAPGQRRGGDRVRVSAHRGHPLFMVQLVDYLAQQAAACPVAAEPTAFGAEDPTIGRAVPQGLQQLHRGATGAACRPWSSRSWRWGVSQERNSLWPVSPQGCRYCQTPWRRCVKGWHDGVSSSTTWGWQSGRTGR